jgi:Orange carotenoid protein, N-terminal
MTSGLQNAETTNAETTNQERPELSSIQGLSTDDQLGLLWVLYEHMGESITPAAPGAADEQFTQRLLEDVKAMEQADQLTFMRNLVEKTVTDQTKIYGSYSENNKLLFWYELAEEMAAGTVVPVPEDYELSSSASEVFNALAALDFNAQITVLRHAALNMGA